MKTAIAALTALCLACSAPPTPDQLAVRNAIASKGWEATCGALMRQTPEQRMIGAAGLVITGDAPNIESAMKTATTADQECERAR